MKLSDYERKSLINFILLYVGSSVFLLSIIAFLMYKNEERNSLEMMKMKMEHFADMQGEEIIKSDILHYLLRNANRAVSAQELMDNLWAYDEVPSNATLRTYIKNLRQIIGKEMIQTLHGEGFKIEVK